MPPSGRRVSAAVGVFAAWVLVTVFLARLWEPIHVRQSINTAVSTAVQPSLVAAILAC